MVVVATTTSEPDGGDGGTFDQSADTFLRDVNFLAGQGCLTDEGDFGDESIRLVLTK